MAMFINRNLTVELCEPRPAESSSAPGEQNARESHLKIYQWDESWNIGIAEIDQQHRHLLGLAERLGRSIVRSNELATLASVLQEIDTVAVVLRELDEYASYHYRTEEEYMRRFEYPEYARHCEEHVQSTRRIHELVLRSQQSRHRFSLELAEFFDVVWRTHVLDFDRRLGEFLRARGVR